LSIQICCSLIFEIDVYFIYTIYVKYILFAWSQEGMQIMQIFYCSSLCFWYLSSLYRYLIPITFVKYFLFTRVQIVLNTFLTFARCHQWQGNHMKYNIWLINFLFFTWIYRIHLIYSFYIKLFLFTRPQIVLDTLLLFIRYFKVYEWNANQLIYNIWFLKWEY